MSYETLFAQTNWTMDRNICPFNGDFIPFKYFSGLLAESWETTDPTTMVIHLRQGVHWQNKPPVNGREFVASDVEAHYKRMLSPDSSPHTRESLSLMDSVTATDKYTVTVKFKKAGPVAVSQLTDPIPINAIEAPEYVALAPTVAPSGGGEPGPGGPGAIVGAGGPLQDWHNVVGTGAWILSDVIANSSVTLTKNPDYWGYDERYPQNKLPYANTLKGIVISDIATSLAALRTGKIDIIGGIAPGVAAIIPWQNAAALAQSNPELKQAKLPTGGGGLTLRVDKVPFKDIRVRKALNMAINREEIAKGYYGGTLDPTPAGMISPTYTGYAYPYSEWSQELKDIYSYNPTKAKALLAEAGYHDGFKTNCEVASNSDLALLQVLKAQLLDIGVDMEIKSMDMAAWQALAYRRMIDQMTGGICGVTAKPSNTILSYLSTDTNQNAGCCADPNYDKLVDEFNAAPTEDDAAVICKAADKYILEQAYGVKLFPTCCYVFYQPYLKGYSGESIIWGNWYYYTARWWIDQNLKK
jgi:peptide/nickel transport system substrate-binding protein